MIRRGLGKRGTAHPPVQVVAAETSPPARGLQGWPFVRNQVERADMFRIPQRAGSFYRLTQRFLPRLQRVRRLNSSNLLSS
jgi:hypothetical protein